MGRNRGDGLEWDDDTLIASQNSISAGAQRDRPYLIVLQGTAVGEMYKIAEEITSIGRGDATQIQLFDDGISRRHAELIHRDGRTYLRDLGSTNGTFCNGQRITELELRDGDKIQVGSTTILKFTFHDSFDESFQKQMYESALRDGLTKAFNKKYFLDRLESEFSYAARHQIPLSLLLFDVDHFKTLNDNFGHLAGDHALVNLARYVSSIIRKEDVFARYGGEEFSIICRGVNLEGAVRFAERLRNGVCSQKFQFQEQTLPVQVSIGVSAIPHEALKQSKDLIAKADEALYQAKRGGRNRVVSL